MPDAILGILGLINFHGSLEFPGVVQSLDYMRTNIKWMRDAVCKSHKISVS